MKPWIPWALGTGLLLLPTVLIIILILAVDKVTKDWDGRRKENLITNITLAGTVITGTALLYAVVFGVLSVRYRRS